MFMYQKLPYATLVKKWSYKENKAPVTKEQVRRAVLSLLYHCSTYISVSSPNQSFCKDDFLKKSMIRLNLIGKNHDVTKTQILSKVSLCVFLDANHYKSKMIRNKWMGVIWISILMFFLITDSHFPKNMEWYA